MAKVEMPIYDGLNAYVGPMQQLMAVYQPKNILEIGLGHYGYSTNVWLSDSQAKLTTVDKGDWKGFAVRFKDAYPDRFTFIKGLTDKVLPKLKREYDFIYIDGDHAYEGCKADILNCQKLLLPGGIILLDDCDVNFPSAVNVDDNGNPTIDMFGVGQAVDECFGDWQRVFTEINFANGGRAYAKA
jgi:predicted O-methyltransferase YrrM